MEGAGEGDEKELGLIKQKTKLEEGEVVELEVIQEEEVNCN